MSKLKVFAYLRVSSPSQAKDERDGFNRQERVIKDYASANSMQVVEVFREQWKGAELDRPKLAQLSVTLENNHHSVKTVIIERLDRLARDYFIQEAIIRDFKSKGFSFISVKDPIDLYDNDPGRKAMRQMLGIFAEYEKAMLIAKLKAAKDRKRAKGGKADGQYGYKDSEEGLEKIKIVKDLYRKPKSGKRRTFQQVADILNQRGMKTLKGKEWSLHRVRDIILNR